MTDDTTVAKTELAALTGDLAKLNAEQMMVNQARSSLSDDHKAAADKAGEGITDFRGSSLEDAYLDQQNRAKGLEQ